MSALYWVRPGGVVLVLGDDSLALGAVRGVRRVSTVRPAGLVKRLAFVALRAVCGDRGRAAAWSRTWRGPWVGRIIGSNRTFCHPSRRVVLAWERSVLESEGGLW